VIAPDVSLTILSTPDAKVKEGTTVTFKLQLMSTGEVPVTASNVSFSVGQQHIETRAATFTGSSNSTELTFTWKATPGTWAITFTADPDNRLLESNETNNKATFSLTVERKSVISGGNGSLLPIWAIIIIIVLVAVGYLGARTFIWSKRLKVAAKEGEEKRRAKSEEESKDYTKLDEKAPSKKEHPKEEMPKKEPAPAKAPEPKEAPKEETVPKEEPKPEEPVTEEPAPTEEAQPEVESTPPEPLAPKEAPKVEETPPTPKKPDAPKTDLDALLDLLNENK